MSGYPRFKFRKVITPVSGQIRTKIKNNRASSWSIHVRNNHATFKSNQVRNNHASFRSNQVRKNHASAWLTEVNNHTNYPSIQLKTNHASFQSIKVWLGAITSFKQGEDQTHKFLDKHKVIIEEQSHQYPVNFR